jgi:hypothetical protein
MCSAGGKESHKACVIIQRIAAAVRGGLFDSGTRRNSEEAHMQTRLLRELRRINRKLDLVIDRLDIIETEGVINMAWIDDMRAELETNTTVSQSAVVALNTLADRMQELINSGADADELQAFVDTLRANDAALTEAIKARTAAVNEPAPQPVEPQVQPEE